MQAEFEQVALYVERRAAEHRAAAGKGGKNASYHRGTAVLFDALASDIRVEFKN